MPITNTPGLAGTISGGGTPQASNPLEGFAEQLLKAKEMQRQAALSNIDAAMKLAEYDPDTAEKIGGPAIQELAKHMTGKAGGGTQSVFREIFTQKGDERKLAKQKSEAELGQMLAATDASKATTTRENTQTAGLKQQQEVQASITASREALKDQTLPAETRADHVRYLMSTGTLPADAFGLMTMTPEQQQIFTEAGFSKQINEARASSFKLAEQAWDLGMDPAQANKYLHTGELPEGFSTPGKRAENLQNRQVGAQEKSADAAMKNADANMLSSQAQMLAAEGSRIAATFKALTEDRAGKYKVIQDSLDTLATLKRSKLPVPEDLLTKLQDDLAALQGLTPTDVKRFLGLWTSRGYKLTGNPDSEATKGENTPSGQVGPDTGASFFDPEVLGGAVGGALQGLAELPGKATYGLAKGAMDLGQSIPSAIEKFGKGMDNATKKKPK